MGALLLPAYWLGSFSFEGAWANSVWRATFAGDAGGVGDAGW